MPFPVVMIFWTGVVELLEQTIRELDAILAIWDGEYVRVLLLERAQLVGERLEAASLYEATDTTARLSR